VTFSLSEPDYTDMTVEQIMSARNIGKKAAYAMKRRQRLGEVGHVPNNQRERVLSILFRNADIKNSNELTEALHADGSEIDGHDTTKVLWSLQKSGHVKFRERQGGHKQLYAIDLTKTGLNDARFIEEKLASLQAEREFQNSAGGDGGYVDLVPPLADQAIADAELDETEGAHTVKPSVLAPEPPAGVEPFQPFDNRFPAIHEVRDRAIRAKRYAEAAKILEEVGEDEIALTLMTKSEFSPLELEVIELIKAYGEEI
jgi:hypothetical protein